MDSQRAMVEAHELGGVAAHDTYMSRSRHRHSLERRHYTVACASPPPQGSVVSTILGAYWVVMEKPHAVGGSYELELEPLKATSLEAHGDVAWLPGGTLH